MRPSLILDTVSRAAFPLVLVFSLYLLFVGHNAPGGGFVAGLTFGIGMVLLYAGGGIDRLRSVITVPWEAMLGAGLTLAGVTGLGSLVLGEPFLSSAILKWQVPLLGEVKLVTVLFFDMGVYLVVTGLVLGLLTVLGAYSDQDVERGAPGRSGDRRSGDREATAVAAGPGGARPSSDTRAGSRRQAPRRRRKAPITRDRAVQPRDGRPPTRRRPSDAGGDAA